MNKFEKATYKTLKKLAKADGVETIYSELTGAAYNALCIAYSPRINSIDCKFITVAVSYCSTEDIAKKKYGKYIALTHFYNDNVLQLPLGRMLVEKGAEQLEEYLLNMFAF